VADVYDALTADRVYRGALSPQRAFQILDADTGTAFDADCVAALRELVAPGFQATIAAVTPARAPSGGARAARART
jgi:HD-GYP domain-containing protein (c-di-GMP phosphodiesterase class II)